jgi:predicted AAA+ superfamily ATPase
LKIEFVALIFQGKRVIIRSSEIVKVSSLFASHPIVGIIGARQVGKTTLARQIVDHSEEEHHFFDLENQEDLARLEDPMLVLKNLGGLIILDEIQRLPNLFPILRVLVDRPGQTARFLLLGSASPELLRQSSETLAGRIAYHRLNGFAVDEVGIDNWKKLWLRGGFPRSYLAPSHIASEDWRKGFIRTFLERDIPQFGITVNSSVLRRFWSMLAHYHGQTWNASEVGRSLGVSHTTARDYLDTLSSALVVVQLRPWFENISKRQVKALKLFFIDSGLLHTFLNIRLLEHLEGHPKVGASWEGFVISQLIPRLGVEYEECYYWATHAGAELDLLVRKGGNRFGFEIKRTSTPKITASM